MYSVVVCSIDKDKTKRITRHYSELFSGRDYELILISDARSLAEAYNRGFQRARGDTVIFSHDDIEFLTPRTWLDRLNAHLEIFDVVGVAGTTRLIAPAWAAAGPPFTFCRVGELDKDAPYRMLYCGAPANRVANIQALDGLFFAVKRKVLERIQFDAVTFDGFHCYDVDFTFSAHLAGFRLGVATDLAILHHSQGQFANEWDNYANRFTAKHKKKLHPMKQRRYQHGLVQLHTKAELVEALTCDFQTTPSA